MKKNKIDFKKFEIIKVGQSQIKGGVNVGSGSTPGSQETIPPTVLPSACDKAS